MKDSIRNNIREIRRNLDKEFVAIASDAIAANFFKNGFTNVQKAMGYLSMENEADISIIIKPNPIKLKIIIE